MEHREMKHVPLITMAASIYERNRVIVRLRRAVIVLSIISLICLVVVGHCITRGISCETIEGVTREVNGMLLPGVE